MPDPTPLSLLTDFGLDDPYVGMMKAAILLRTSNVNLIDITHSSPPQDIVRAAILLFDSYRYFPTGTVHLIVVDPGVGSNRHILAAECEGYRFVAPDNGLIDPILRCSSASAVYYVQPEKIGIDAYTATFHGRDIMAPVAAELAKGKMLSQVGIKTHEWVKLDLPFAKEVNGEILGSILYADHFGNLITNIRPFDLEHGDIRLHEVEIEVAGTILKGIWHTYTDVQPGELCAVINSCNRLEIACRQSSALAHLNVEEHDPVIVRRRSDT